MRILVTGGLGFIGRYVCEEINRRNHVPVVLDRTGARIGTHPWESILGDVRDAGSVFDAMAHVDAWVHLAGILGTQETIHNPVPAAETNILGGLNVLRAANEYHLPGVTIAVGNWFMDNTYAISKHTIERFAAMFRAEFQLPVTTVRAFNAYGPGQAIAAPFGPSKVRKIVPSFIARALAGEPIEVYGDGSQVMDMIHVRDVAWSLVESLGNTIRYGGARTEVHAGTGRSTDVNFVAELVSEAVGDLTHMRPPVEHLPMRPGEPPQSVVLADPAKIIPSREPMIPLELGIRETVEWYAKEWLPTWRS